MIYCVSIYYVHYVYYYQVCGRTFTQTNNLYQHMKLHNDTKQYKCPVCGRPFTQKAGMLGHMRNHRDIDTPHKCADCPKQFTSKSGLVTHSLVHSRNGRRVQVKVDSPY
jgi:KRAB domain-containing zinc finger protein